LTVPRYFRPGPDGTIFLSLTPLFGMMLKIQAAAVILPAIIILSLHACFAGVTILGTPLLDLCIEAANRSWDVHQGRLEDDPYNPGSYAWSLSHALRSFVRLYTFTGDMLWVDRAVSWIDHMVNYSDVNADGRPSWGNYNETWGTDRYDYAEYTVHDGIICIPVIELVECIYGDDRLSGNLELKKRADEYLGLVEEIIEYHSEFWTDVSEESGYYWRITAEDDLVVINQFAALATAELMVADVTGNESYLVRPGKMARFVRDHLVYVPDVDCYVWDYSVGGRVEDISHGTIDLELMIMAHEHNLTFTLEDMNRLANTYQRRIWRGVEMYRDGIGMASHVDGSTDGEEHARDAKTYPYLSRYRPQIYPGHIAAVEVMARNRLPMDRVMARHFAELIEVERWLENEGIDIGSLDAFEPWMVLPEVDALNESVTRAEAAGADVSAQRALADELYSGMESALEGDVSELVASIWEATAVAEREWARGYIEIAESLISQASDMGVDTSRHELFLERARQSFSEGLYESAVNMCDYPLRLREVIDEPVYALLLLGAAAIALRVIRIRRGSRMATSTRTSPP